MGLIIATFWILSLATIFVLGYYAGLTDGRMETSRERQGLYREADSLTRVIRDRRRQKYDKRDEVKLPSEVGRDSAGRGIGNSGRDTSDVE